MQSGKIFDLLVIGGGINGAGIALDAAGRELSVVLCEQNDLSSGTSWVSTKLIHGGLRYLEQLDFMLVKKALAEREVMLNKAPHLISPLELIIPHDKHQRPGWMIRLGLLFYDHLSKRFALPSSRRVKLDENNPYGMPLKTKFKRGFSFYDCFVDDARLVIANAMGASELGAIIKPNTQVTHVTPYQGLWKVSVFNKRSRHTEEILARTVVNATGPWIGDFFESQSELKSSHRIRLVKGSHIIIPKLYRGDHAYLLQHKDNRVIFVIPYQDLYTLIGTTESDYHGSLSDIKMDDNEKNYLVQIVNQHFKTRVTTEQIMWHFSGVRPLLEDEKSDSTKLSRDYKLELKYYNEAPILSVYGGKITTYRELSEQAVNLLCELFPGDRSPWTRDAPLPGGEFNGETFEHFFNLLALEYPFIPEAMLKRLAHQYGTRIHLILKNTKGLEDLGACFGADLYEAELRYLVQHEWAKTAEDCLFRRTKLGLQLSLQQQEEVEEWLCYNQL